MDEPPAGYEVPIHRSLTEPVLLFGLPREIGLSLWAATAALVFTLHQIWFLPLAIVVHVIFTGMVRRDPHVFTIVRRAIHAQRRLDP